MMCDMTGKDLILNYLEYLYSIRQSEILKDVLDSREHDAWSLNVIAMIAEDEYLEIKDQYQPKPMSLQDLIDKIQMVNRDKKIETILDK